MSEQINPTQSEIKKTVREFIEENFLAFSGQEAFEDADSFMERGIIESTGVLELLEFIEDRFKIKVEDEEIIPDNLDTHNDVTCYIRKNISVARK